MIRQIRLIWQEICAKCAIGQENFSYFSGHVVFRHVSLLNKYDFHADAVD